MTTLLSFLAWAFSGQEDGEHRTAAWLVLFTLAALVVAAVLLALHFLRVHVGGATCPYKRFCY